MGAMADNPETKSSNQLIDWVALVKRFDNRQEFIEKLLRRTSSSHVDMLEKLRSATLKRDLHAIAFIAHGLRGSASNLYAHKVRDCATKTEESVRAGQPDPIALAEELAKLLESLLAEIARHLESSSGSKL
jgi:HPt (histidine-containing phosphotransfer) domain-containing protein